MSGSQKNAEITGIVPAAGLGTRLRPHTFTLPKVLISVAGKPILGYILDSLERVGIRRVVFVIGHLGEKVEQFVRANYGFETVFIEQTEFLGLGYAVHLTRKHVPGPALIVLGDTIVKTELESLLGTGESWIGVRQVEDPRRFGVVVERPDGTVARLVEKPETFLSNRAIVGIYCLRNSPLLFESLSDIVENGKTNNREFQLTDGLQRMVERGEVIRAVPIQQWFDCGKVETLLATNRYLLEERAAAEVNFASVVVNPPAHIGVGVKLRNCVVGPHVSVGDRVEMENVIIQDSIVNEGAVLRNAILAHSVIGHEAVLEGSQQKINLGDYSEMSTEEGF